MYRAITKRRVRAMFAALSTDEWKKGFDPVADDVRHVFPGDHAMGGERRSREAMIRWFERVRRLVPELQFEVERVSVSGPPWDMWVSVEWRDYGRDALGMAYENEGAHWMRIRRGKATYVHAYLDTQRVAEVCRRLAEGGIAEAAEPPITD